jgi:D-sedoheptulose 7-phosphate isomerase
MVNNLEGIARRISFRQEVISQNLTRFTEFIDEASEIVYKALQSGNKIMFCGNGGSAAESQHMAAEYCATLDHKRPRDGFAALSLTVDTSLITAWSNDFGFDGIFSRQVESLGNDGDILMAYSTSGSSKNILKAIKTAKLKSIKIISFTGDNLDSQLNKTSDIVFNAPFSQTPYIQECHTIVGHEVCLEVERKFIKYNEA